MRKTFNTDQDKTDFEQYLAKTEKDIKKTK